MALSISNLIGVGARAGLGALNPGLVPFMSSFKKKQQPQNLSFGSSVDPNKSVQSGGLTMLRQGTAPYANQQTQTTTPTVSTAYTPPAQPQQSRGGGIINTAYAAPKETTDFGSVIKGMIDPPKKASTRLTKSVEESASESSRIAEQAKALSQKYGDEIARVGQLGAGAVAGHMSTGTNVVGSGNAAIASQSASQRMNALAQGYSTELQGVGEQLRGQELQTSGLNMALQGGLTQQQQQLSGMQTAGGLIQPGVAGYGQTVFDPLTGTYKGGGGNLDPNNVASQLAQKVLSGQMTYEQAVSSLGYAGSAGQQFLNSALQQAQPGFNAPLASAQVGGQAGVIGSLPQMQSADIAAEGIKNKLVTYLSSNPQLNPNDLALANEFQQWVEGKQLTDPKYQTLFNYLNEYTNTLTPILGVGGSSTNLKTEIAQSFVNPSASGQSISEVLENIQRLSKGKIQDLRSGAVGGSTVSNSGSSAITTQAADGNSYGFYQDANGVWHAR